MQERLTIGCYGSEFGLKPENAPFGLAAGQMRVDGKIAHNHGWYNLKGEKLGFGDLSVADARKIMSELLMHEAFITLCEGDSWWDAKRNGVEDINSPGLAYVLEHARYVFLPGQAYSVNEYILGLGELYQVGTKGNQMEVSSIGVPLLRLELARLGLIPAETMNGSQAA